MMVVLHQSVGVAEAVARLCFKCTVIHFPGDFQCIPWGGREGGREGEREGGREEGGGREGEVEIEVT